MTRSTRAGVAILGATALLAACQDTSIPDPSLLPSGRINPVVSAGAAIPLTGIVGSEGFGSGDAVNNLGMVAGSSDDTVTVGHAALWAADGTVTKLDPFPANHWAYNGRGYSYAFGVNDAGDAVGYSFQNGQYSMTATLWQGGGQTLLGTLGGYTSRAFDINNVGQVVGESAVPSGPNQPFMWSLATGMVQLGAVAGSNGGQANAINDYGWAVGYYRNATGGNVAIVWGPDGTGHDLGVGPGSNATGINDLGQVVGYRQVEGSTRAFIWTLDDGFQDIGAGRPTGINNASVVVGELGGVGSAYWSAESGIVALNGLDGTPWNSSATAIGDNGTVSGTASGRPVKWQLTGASPTIPTAPNTVRGMVSPGLAVRVLWNAGSSNEIHFELMRRIQNLNGSWSGYSPVAEPPHGATTHLDSALLSGRTYQYRMRACNTAGCSGYAFSPAIEVGPVPASPSAPVGTVPQPNRIQVRWTDLSGDENRFELARRRRNADSTWQGYTALPLLAANTTSKLDSAVYTSYAYQYRIRACNGYGCSAWSEGAVVSLPLAPGPLTVDPPSSPVSLTLHWTDRSPDETGFQVGRRTATGPTTWGPYSTIRSVGANATGTTDNTVTSGMTYQYRVRACNASGCSAWRLGTPVTMPPS